MTNIFDAIEEGNLDLIKTLIEAGANLEEFNDEGLLPIHLAAINNNFEIVKLLIESGADVNSESSLGITLAHVAAGQFVPEQLDWLFDKGMNIKIEGPHQVLPIHVAANAGSLENVKWFFDRGIEDKTVKGSNLLHAAISGNFDGFLQSIKNGTFCLKKLRSMSDKELSKSLDLLKYLLDEKEYDVNIQNNKGATPLSVAASFGNLHIMNFLKERGADVNQNIEDAIFVAVSQGFIDVIKWFVEQGVNIKEVRKYNNSPISMAAFNGQVKVMEYLFELGSDLYDLDCNGNSLIHSAVLGDNPEVIEWLLDRGLDINIPDARCTTPASHAIYNGKIKCLKYFAERGVDINLEHLNLRSNPKLTIELIQWLQSRGYNIEKENYTLMHCAAYNGQIDIMEYLLSQGLEINIKDCYGNTPIYYATENSQLKAIKYLYEHGVDVRDQDERGNTLMHAAARKGKVHIIQWLLDKGVPVDSINLWEKTPVNSAAQKGRLKIIDYLGKKGANISDVRSYAEDLIEYAAIEEDVSIIEWLQQQKVEIKGLTFVTGLPLGMSLSKFMQAPEWIGQYGVKTIVSDSDRQVLMLKAAVERNDKVVQLLQNHTREDQKYFIISNSSGYFRDLDEQIEATYWLLEKGIKIRIKGEAIEGIIFYNEEKVDKIIKWFEDLDINIDSFLDNWESIISHAAEKGIVNVLDWIQKCGAPINVNLSDNYGYNLIHRSIQSDNAEIFQWCIRNGANLDLQDNHGNTALHLAIYSDKLQYVELLLEHGANLDLQDNHGANPLLSAIYGNKHEIITLLCSFKANIDLTSFSARNYFTNSDNLEQIFTYGDIRKKIAAATHIADALARNDTTSGNTTNLREILFAISQVGHATLYDPNLLTTEISLQLVLENLDKIKILESLNTRIQELDENSKSYKALQSFLSEISDIKVQLETKQIQLLSKAIVLPKNDPLEVRIKGFDEVGIEILSHLDEKNKVKFFVTHSSKNIPVPTNILHKASDSQASQEDNLHEGDQNNHNALEDVKTLGLVAEIYN